MAGIAGESEGLGANLYKYDLDSGKSWTHDLAGGQSGEPVFATSPSGTAEDDGWILTFMYDPTRDKSDLLIIDATDFEKKPVARVHMPTRVPFGFHGSWIAGGA